MKSYIGTKFVNAKPMNKYEFYMNIKGVDCKEDNEEGYLVQYPDGYTSWSPKDVFEKSYHENGHMTFGQAFDELKKGYVDGIRLPQWEPDVVIRIQRPDEHSKMTAPYLYVESRYGRVPWKETMIELFAENWEVIPNGAT